MKNEVNVAKWEHLEMLLKEDPGFDGLRMLPKLTESHLNPKKLKKMEVKCAAQVLSHSTAIFMGYLARKGILVEDARETARVLLFFDELFDSVNGSFHNFKKKPGKKLLGPLTPNSTHQKVWDEAKAILKTMTFIDKSNKTGNCPCLVSLSSAFHYKLDKNDRKY
ncbi:unnamed protein product [Arctia plantaginis]|uniref:Transposable element P transposase-like GTP-binding insertion domain-containing protein n=1 Tax=Arctia plantaginis TaxID=874455 RepID=A0A8S1ARI5_ARCPL|nr:unnamed protein product [Arctia plantaginis]CAB3250904.1 unnamed protein product [Arctia plantaginis]